MMIVPDKVSRDASLSSLTRGSSLAGRQDQKKTHLGVRAPFQQKFFSLTSEYLVLSGTIIIITSTNTV
jgi:hypothetical protein